MDNDLNFNINIQNEKTSYQHEESKKEPVKSMTNMTNTNVEALTKQTFTEKYNIFNSAHPKVCFFTIVFKTLAILCYFFLGMISDTHSFIFITVVIASAFDFWMLKNISGRILVGLRWWSDFKEDGAEVWIFESYDGQMEVNSIDSSIFWSSQYFSFILWGIFLFFNILSMNIYWAMLNMLVVTLVSINLMGFHKCGKEHEKKMSDLKDYVKSKGFKFVGEQLMKNAFKGVK